MASISYKPLYQQVRELLLARIDNGSYCRGDIIPSESVLAKEFGTSISTIRQAISMLAADGLLVKKQGKGTYVSGRKTTIRFFDWFDTHDSHERQYLRQAVRNAIESFQNTNQSIAVEYIPADDRNGRQELLRLITEGNAPDVAHIPSHWTSYFASLGALAPLEDLLPPKNLKNHLNDQDICSGRYRNTLYSIAWGLCPVSLLVNTQTLQQAGIELPDLPMTLDDFSAICQELDDFYNGKDIYSYALSFSDNRKIDFFAVYPTLQAFGGGFMTRQGDPMLNSPENVAAFHWLRQFIHTRRIYHAEIPAIRKRFARGEITFMSDRPWIKGYLEELTGEPFEQNFAVVLNPTCNGIQSYSWCDNHGLSICTQSQHRTQAAKLISALISDKKVCHTFYAKTGILPVDKDHLKDPLYSSEFFRKYMQQLTHASHMDAQHPMFMKAMSFCAHTVRNILDEGCGVEHTLAESESSLRILYEE